MQQPTLLTYMKTSNLHTTRNGFSLVEMIMYVSIVTIFASGLIVSVISLIETRAMLDGREEITYSETLALERISREIRRASSVDTVLSVFNTSPGTLILETTDSLGNPTVITVNVTGGTLFLQEGSGTPSALTTASIQITNLVFTHFTNTNTEGVQIEMTVQKTVQGEVVTKDYRTFVILRG